MLNGCFLQKVVKIAHRQRHEKKALIALAEICNYTLNRLVHSENVNTDTLVKICRALNCNLEDVIELTKD